MIQNINNNSSIYIIYMILFPNGFHYTGSTKDLEKRLQGYSRIYPSTKGQPLLRKALEKYGLQNAEIIILLTRSKKSGIYRIGKRYMDEERFIIEKYNLNPDYSLNIKIGGVDRKNISITKDLIQTTP